MGAAERVGRSGVEGLCVRERGKMGWRGWKERGECVLGSVEQKVA